jgi:hypothetical protein
VAGEAEDKEGQPDERGQQHRLLRTTLREKRTRRGRDHDQQACAAAIQPTAETMMASVGPDAVDAMTTPPST